MSLVASRTGSDEPRPVRDASDLPERAVEDPPEGRDNQAHITPKSRTLTGDSKTLTPLLPSDPDPEWTLPLDQHLDECLSITDDPTDSNMDTSPNLNKKNGFSTEPENRGDSDQIGSQSENSRCFQEEEMVCQKPNAFSWVQIAGHPGNFLAGEEGTLLKRSRDYEKKSLPKLMKDSLQPFVPKYYGLVQRGGQDYNRMENLLNDFVSPSIMDCKMGTRTFLETELRREKKYPVLRKDLYEKMVSVEPWAPTKEEHAQQGVLKARYMKWRDTVSSTTTLGFRIDGIKKADGTCNTSFKTMKKVSDVMKAIQDFVGNDCKIALNYLRELKELRSVLEKSEFFRRHEVVGSSLLFMHDCTGKTKVRMIDFGKTVTLLPSQTITHRKTWTEGNREDGYLHGLDNLIDLFTKLNSLTS